MAIPKFNSIYSGNITTILPICLIIIAQLSVNSYLPVFLLILSQDFALFEVEVPRITMKCKIHWVNLLEMFITYYLLSIVIYFACNS